MDASIIRDQLHQYLDVANDEKIKAIYVILEDSIEESKIDYSEEDKAELDRRVEYYLSGGKMVTPEEMNGRLLAIRGKRNKV